MRLGSTVPPIHDGPRKHLIAVWCCKAISIRWRSRPAALLLRPGCAISSPPSGGGRIFLTSATASCRTRPFNMSSLCSILFAGVPLNEQSLSLDQGAAYLGHHLLDGGDAVSAASLRLSRRSAERLSASENLRGDGEEAHARDHAAHFTRDVDNRSYACGSGGFCACGLVSRKIRPGDRPQRAAWIFRKSPEGFGGRDQPAWLSFFPDH